MTYNIWQLSVILSFISTVVPGKAKIVQFNGPVKLFVDKDSKSNFTTNIITYFNKVSKNGYQIIYADGANMCSLADIQFVLKTLTTTQITIILNEHMNTPCELPIERGAILQFFKTEDFITVHFINQGVRMPNIRFHENEVGEIDRFLNDVGLSIESNVRRRRQVRRINGLREEENSGTTATVNLWVIVVIAVIISLGFIIIITLFYFDHRKNLKRIAALGKELMESKRSETRIKLPPEVVKKNNQKMDDEDKKEKELGKREKARKQKVDKDNEKNDESSKTSILNAKRVPLFVRDVFNIANFCLGYGGIEEVVKRDIKTVASGTINSDNIGPNETSSSPVAIIDELETIILPMFQQFPKMRSHSFFPGVQSLTDILIEFGCNLLAARGFITDGSPGMLELEMVATSWVGKALGLPSCFLPGRRTRGGGLLLTTTTEGMFTAILAARQKKLREILNANAADRGKEKSAANEEDSLLKNMVAYGCSEAHLSFDFGCRLAKVEDKLINPDAEYTMNVDELEHEIMEDVKNKRTPIFINATFGSAHSCSLDKLDEITKIAKKYNIWVHVDASYAGNYLVCPSYRSLVNGLENANSFSVNLHKCLTQSSHATFFWTTDLRAVKDSIPQSQNMLRTLHSDGSYYELATTASNRYKPLKTYLWLRLCGLEGLRQQITTIVKMTSRFRQLLNDDGRLEDKTATQDFGFITFRCKGGKEEQASQKTYRFCCYIIKSNKMSVTLVAPRSMNMIRMTFNREHFDEEEIDDSWNVLKRLLDDWEAEEGRGKIATKSECERLICNGINSRFTQPSSVSIATPKPSIIIPSPMETIQVPNDIKTSEKGQIRPRNFENGQDNRIMKNSAVCDSMENAKEIPQNTTPLQTSAKEISNKAASMREKSEEKRSAKDTEASSSSEKEEDAEEGKRLSTRTGNRQISSTSEGEEFPSERNENSTSSQSFGRSSGRQQPSAAEGGNSAAKKASTSSFKTLKTECLQRSKHKLPEQTGKKLSRNEKRYNTEGSTSKRK